MIPRTTAAYASVIVMKPILTEWNPIKLPTRDLRGRAIVLITARIQLFASPVPNRR